MMVGPTRRGKQSDTKKGTKPAIAFESQKLAQHNISEKVKHLTAILREVENVGLPPDAPDSPRQFNKWAPEVDKISLKPNSQETLKRHQDLHRSVISLVSAVKQHRSQPTKDSRGERLSSARRVAHGHKVIREIAERALVSARTEAVQATKQKAIIESQLMSERKAAAAMIESLQRQVEDLTSSNAALTKQLSKIIGLRAK